MADFGNLREKEERINRGKREKIGSRRTGKGSAGGSGGKKLERV